MRSFRLAFFGRRCQARRMTHPLPFTWPYALIFWAVFLWAYFPEYAIIKNASREQSKTDSKSLQIIMAGQSIGMLLAFGIAWWPGMLMPFGPRVAAFVVGTLLVFLGSLLRRHCWRMLGASFTGDVRANADQRVVTEGAYRFVRHPSYSAGIILTFGLGLALGSWPSAAVALVFTLASYIYRMNVEERALMAEIGEPYRAFARTRKRLVPFLY
jgi:protein-S-isoprenylcysteine O-methyltransferase Ste14